MITTRRAATLLLAGATFLLGDSTQAQEQQGCFMIDPFNQFVDLNEICPSGGGLVLGTGDIQATLRWASTDDLDLAVIDPNGDEVNFLNTTVPSGGQLDVDANAGCLGGLTQTPVENVFWPPSEAPTGEYSVAVRLFERCVSGAEAIPFEVTLLVQGNTETLSGSVSNASPVAEFAFTMP
ncbi:MAG: hypothetical protein ACFB4J_04100 [Elainellaceae cyanobacterium]